MIDATARTIPTVAQMRDNSLSGVVRHEIETLILSGELPAGSRVNENAIALRLGVSRGPVREACRALVELGLLDLIPNRGVFVRRMDRHDVEEVYDLRAGLTGLAGSLVAARVSDAEMDRLRALVTAMDESAAAGDFRSFYPVNLEFHDVILQLTGNSRLVKSYRALIKEFQLFRTHGLVQPNALRESNEEHRAILDALERRDSAAAYDTSFRHVLHGKQRMFAAFDKLAHAGAAGANETHNRTIE
ncbi:MAG TPA: FCD domain-containing protein [Dongiaceae bacterium]|nr:FCD domain-containing protein [Dongiaceae bacterium]